MQKFSASMAVSKHRICSISLSRKRFSRDSTVEITDIMACSEVLKAEPANQLGLMVGGSFLSRSWNWFFPFTRLGPAVPAPV